MYKQLEQKMKEILRMKVIWKGNWRPLKNNNDNDAQNGLEGEIEESHLSQTIIPADREQRSPKDPSSPKDLSATLALLPDVLCLSPPAEGGTPCSACPPQIHTQPISLMQTFWVQLFQKLCQNLDQNLDLDQNLQAHLVNLQEAVFPQLERLSLQLEPLGLMAQLCECCHRHTFDHLHTLLERVQSCRSYFVLMNWVRDSYMSHEIFSSTDGWKVNEWETEAKGKLLENVQKDVKSQIGNILKSNEIQEHCATEEDYVKLFVDVIQCVDSMQKAAQKIDPDLYNQVSAVCFHEMLTFVNEYVAQQKEVLKKKAKMDKLETIHFLKTLKTCKEIKKHIQNTKREEMEKALVTLRELEDLTLKLLTGAVADVIERNMKKYFKSDHRSFFQFKALAECFPQKTYVQDEHEMVMGEIYKVTAHIYFKHLILRSVRSLKRCWSHDIGGAVLADAEELHELISDLAPNVRQWNTLLLLVPDVLTGQDIDGLKLTMAQIHKECQDDDLRLLPDLLRWKGLSRKDVRAVIEALPDSRPPPPPPPSRSPRFCCC